MLQLNDKRLFSLCALVFCLTLTAVVLQAQDSSKSASAEAKATQFWDSKDSLGPRWDLSEEPGVFTYVEQLRHERPCDTVVYIAYGPLGEVAWYLREIKAWLKRYKPDEANQIFTFDGGRADKLRYEAWLIPEGAKMPEVTGPPAEDERAVLEFTKYHYATKCEYCMWQGRSVLRALVEALRQRPRRKAYLEFYGCGSIGGGRPRSAARHEASGARRILIKEGGIAPSRIIVKIRERSKSSCESRIWLLPPHLNSLQR